MRQLFLSRGPSPVPGGKADGQLGLVIHTSLLEEDCFPFSTHSQIQPREIPPGLVKTFQNTVSQTGLPLAAC